MWISVPQTITLYKIKAFFKQLHNPGQRYNFDDLKPAISLNNALIGIPFFSQASLQTYNKNNR